MRQEILYTNEVNAALDKIIKEGSYNVVIALADNNTKPLTLQHLPCLSKVPFIEIPAGDDHKNLDTIVHVWHEMERCRATRQSLLVNVGGGMVTDLGGMAATTFKRGIDFVNVPTSLLGAVDAAVGGKTGINFNGLKNEIGTFAPARAVIVSTSFFSTLPTQEMKSGFAEMLKHAMLNNRDEFMELLVFDFNNIDPDALLIKLQKSIKVKQEIVDQDPTEQGLRKVLNLGHTVGHAFESKALHDREPVPHGFAVAWGLVTETVLSHMLLGFPSEDLYSLARFVHDNYGAYHITCDHYNQLIALMRHDKKSNEGEINCTLLSSCGNPKINNIITETDIKAALDIYRDLMGI